MNEREYLRQLADEARDTEDMLSSRRKSERERRVVAAFLRCLGVGFCPVELIAQKSDPPDVVFRDARFAVMIRLDEERKMHADWKRNVRDIESATGAKDFIGPPRQNDRMSLREVASLASTALGRKASHYGLNTCSQLDALLYVNLLESTLNPLSEAHVPEKLQAQGWRSVSLIFHTYSHVLYATAKAPVFLRQYEGSTRHECQESDVWSDL